MLQIDVIQALLSDAELNVLIEGRISPFSENIEVINKGTCLTYQFTPFTNDKVKRTDRLEIRIIAKTLLEAMTASELVNDCLLTFADRGFNNKVLNISQNGGGSSENLATGKVHYFLFYDLKSRV